MNRPAGGPAGAQRAAELEPVTALKGVGVALAERLRKLGVETVQDLLFLLPLRYEDRTRTVPIGSLRPGDRAVIEGTVDLAEIVFRKKRALLVRLGDGTGSITLRFFYFSGAQQEQLVRGTRLRCFGEVRRGPLGLEIVHPEYRRAEARDAQATTDRLTPVYPATEGVQQGRLRVLTALALEKVAASDVHDWLPPALLAGEDLPTLAAALEYVHRPPPDAELELLAAGMHPAQRRLAFEELLAHQLSLRMLRRSVRRDPAWPMAGPGELEQRFASSLPFSLTGAQQRVLAELRVDVAKPHPMLRLVQGDVGSGKTVVAAMGALRAVESDCQAALMAPTELLAEQHFQNFQRWFEPLGIGVTLLSGRLTGRARQLTLDSIAAGKVPVVIGTHALFQAGVKFAKLGLAIVDEQHRFGVHQRLALREKGISGGRYPHQLVMTATPIPRTLAMTAYADLDVSVIDELPPGRTPIVTVVLPESRRDEVVARIHGQCLEGRQAYWVCPLIEESELLEAQAAEETAAALAAALPDVRVGLVHGRMAPADKERSMARFKAGEIQLLVATTVIEVGVDVPNASLMVIENAERMGLAQLHQLRGRVGRGAAASSCVLLYKGPLSQTARARLTTMRETTDGFEVARRDLELRGPGEFLGTRQAGLMQLKVADLTRDADVLPKVQRTAEVMLDSHPDNIAPLLRRWIGAGARYAKA
ncbi:MAG: ATP-dependent DNA helicase RecG [Gammaproteobacteria bacterium]|nr:ATP-dependent DNA helicase RecG [Gammaproteobacteria bacterium]